MDNRIEKLAPYFQRVLFALTLFLTIALVTLCVMKFHPSLFFTNDKSWKLPELDKDLPKGSEGKLIKYGFYLVTESPKWMGPQVKNEEFRFSGNNLSCKNCHLDNGTKPGSASFVGVPNRFPQFRGRENKTGTLKERINGCMERSMNGRELPEDSQQMEAIIAYMEWLSEDVPAEIEARHKGFVSLEIPETRADTIAGRIIYERECVSCHGADGQGEWLTDRQKGYLYPPLWGNDSFNHGAGMTRILTAAEFIKGNMPFGATVENPFLTDEEAYNVAAYIDSFSRPLKLNPENDFPDKKLKPVSTPYGPWEDPFPADQHKYGPFQPIMKYYETEYGIKKSK